MEPKIQRSLEISWKEGIPASVMLGILDYYLVPFGLFLGATSRGIAFLVALPQLLASVAQLGAVRVVRWWGGRLRSVVGMAAVQAAVLLPMAGLALAAFPGRLAALVLLAVCFRVLNNLVGTAWGSLVSEYLPAARRGGYFGWRAQVVGIAGVAGVALGGLILFGMKEVSLAWGFFLVFFLAGLLRLLSSWLLSQMADLPLQTPPGSDFTLVMFLRRFRESNFVRFVLFVSSILLATYLSAPYFSVYMLKDLQMSYLTYMTVHLAAVLGGLIACPIWGRHADLVGNARILKMTGCLVPFIPFLWLVSSSTWYLVGVELLAGFVWGGFNLCVANFIYDAVTPEKRVRCIGYFNLFSGMALFCGALLGGFLADHLPAWFGPRLLTLFALSGLLRLGAFLWFSWQFREVRETVHAVSSLKLFFSVVGIRPVTGEASEWSLAPFFRKAFIRRTRG